MTVPLLLYRVSVPTAARFFPYSVTKEELYVMLAKENGVPKVCLDKIFGDMAMTHTLHFNSKHTYRSAKEADNEDSAEGPVVERRCPQCQNDKMSYATLQLRSADEGQTVFYTCTKCKYKETENS
ncbi:PREDICTED: DNA-directed RNA polymerase I subunit RPA12 isoform X1 [Dinoponera quadriceps]|uniref:DNA-directed RNA polymerase I subunit RPA12 n=1 Tax=Dinoponera quadriceps TaxID=609295 RepID=A0A6P3WVI2_DINQU|nr:PREDICTED: DNA-directed RNA polymerase I subunit RPA12 isoform X1 [Dinoponera quadriceps]